jgi:hypothetical protein
MVLTMDERWLRVLLLMTAGMLCLASGRSRPASAGQRLLKPSRDKQLNHPALRVINRYPEVLQLALKGPIKRMVVAPPHENTRTLVAAGTYRFELRLGGRVVHRGRFRLLKGHRYRLEMAP